MEACGLDECGVLGPDVCDGAPTLGCDCCRAPCGAVGADGCATPDGTGPSFGGG